MRIFATFATLLLIAPTMQSTAHSQANAQPAQASAGHGIKCMKADGKTPCTASDVSGLNQDIADFKQTFGDAKSTVGDTQQSVGDAKQTAADTKQTAAEAQHPVANATQSTGDAKQTASDVKQNYSDVQQTKSDAQSTVQDAQQNAQDAQQAAKEMKGIGSLALRALDGAMNCAQNNGAACTDNQTKALQTHAAQKKPPLTVKRDVDQASN